MFARGKLFQLGRRWREPSITLGREGGREEEKRRRKKHVTGEKNHPKEIEPKIPFTDPPPAANLKLVSSTSSSVHLAWNIAREQPINGNQLPPLFKLLESVFL